MRSKIFRVLAVILAVVVLGVAGLMLTARPVAPHPYFANFSRYPLVIAHADDTGNGLWPGNTLAFLEGIAELGVDVLEMDVHMTRDGQIVLIHDDTVDRTTNGTGNVWDLTLAEIQTLEVGDNWTQDDGATYPYRGREERIPTLEAVLQKFPAYPMNIEIKQAEPPMAEPLCALIKKYNRQNLVIVASFSDAAMQSFRAACPEVATAPSRGEVTL